MKTEKVIDVLNKVLENELAGVVRYTHYSLMVFGHNRIPIVKWFRDQANEALTHAQEVGEHITALGGHPSLKIGKLVETHKHSLNDILTESLEHEEMQLKHLYEVLELVSGKNIYLEEFVRKMIYEEEGHVVEVKKMLKQQLK
ncbi:MAG: ferritin-like domain-containing protein [Bdellovibrionaceae bacterium]|nr:ferritin-like domain-containing protein [Pseudobdellovibrionaceae bacterium]MDW8190418.1 ferritin-like domain-containing protein [Pseudobdellovibrionaceae bacterium]